MGSSTPFSDPDALLPLVDAVEGYVPGDPLRCQYTRSVVSVTLGERREQAWTYFYSPSLGSADWIPSGDYRQHTTRGVGVRADVRASTKSVIAAWACADRSMNSIPD